MVGNRLVNTLEKNGFASNKLVRGGPSHRLEKAERQMIIKSMRGKQVIRSSTGKDWYRCDRKILGGLQM